MSELIGGLFQKKIYTPASLAAGIQKSFDQEFGHIWVEGEIAELSLPQSGHAYFSLKDREAKLKAAMWKGRRLYAGSALSEGLTVLAKGRLSVYAPRGEYQLVVDYLEPKGEGALRLAFEKLKAKLTAEGLFDQDRKRSLPFWPRRVAVVSSPSGAAARDFIETALTRRPDATVCLYPVRVQGSEAAREIAEAMTDLNAWGGFDLIVLTRGGGSLEDLWAFNEEAVVRAVAASRTTTLAAIGHSTDLSLTELAADVRAITPTAAAEAVFRDQAVILGYLADQESRLAYLTYEAISRRRDGMGHLDRRLGLSLEGIFQDRRVRFADLARRLGRFEDRLGHSGRRLDELSADLHRALKDLLASHEQRLQNRQRSLTLLSPAPLAAEKGRITTELHSRLHRALKIKLVIENQKLARLTGRLHDLSPESILRRGYALVTRSQIGGPVSRAADLAAGETVGVRLAEGAFTAEVKDIT